MKLKGVQRLNIVGVNDTDEKRAILKPDGRKTVKEADSSGNIFQYIERNIPAFKALVRDTVQLRLSAHDSFARDARGQ